MAVFLEEPGSNKGKKQPKQTCQVGSSFSWSLSCKQMQPNGIQSPVDNKHASNTDNCLLNSQIATGNELQKGGNMWKRTKSTSNNKNLLSHLVCIQSICSGVEHRSDCNWQLGRCLGCWLDGTSWISLKTENRAFFRSLKVTSGVEQIICSSGGLEVSWPIHQVVKQQTRNSKDLQGYPGYSIILYYIIFYYYLFLFFPRAVQVHTHPLSLWATGPRLSD